MTRAAGRLALGGRGVGRRPHEVARMWALGFVIVPWWMVRATRRAA
jgi:hypothetical protein